MVRAQDPILRKSKLDKELLSIITTVATPFTSQQPSKGSDFYENFRISFRKRDGASL